jgi:Uncharacterised nucleotidyltransferase
LSCEDELSLLLARGRRRLSSGERTRVLQFLGTPLQWPLLLECAYSHQVYPLVYRNLLAFGFSGVPEAVQAELKGAYLANAFRNQLLAEELTRLLKLLDEARIPVIPLKGVTLAQSLFGDPAARVCSDIDILVPPGETVGARGVILRNGYSSPFSEEFFVNHQLRTSPDCPLVSETKVLTYLVELHWTILCSSSKNKEITENLWSQARPQQFYGVHACNLSPEWEFVFLALHAASHKWSSLKWLIDIHELCESGTVDWNQVKETVERFELDNFVGPTLTACSLLFKTPVPPQIPRLPVPSDVHLFPNSLAASESWKVPLFYPRLLKRPSEKLRWFARGLPGGPDFLALARITKFPLLRSAPTSPNLQMEFASGAGWLCPGHR